MASEGCRLTQFYAGNPVCSPSRSALLTGRNCIRTGVLHVFKATSTTGMSLDEITLADALKPLGYNTACIGKWHLGCVKEYMPLRQGFDYFYGLPHSNDMQNADIWRGEEIIEKPADQTTLTRRYTEEAIQFMERSGADPFLIYLPYSFPHVPLFRSEAFTDVSLRGLYGDVIQELDWSVGQINDALDRMGLAENTLVMFTSDNGPWISQHLEGGSAGLLRGGKGDTWEGGMREPFIARWPGKIPAGTVSESVGSVLDFFPTCVKLAGGELPADRPYDGIDLLPVLTGGAGPERPVFYYERQHLNAVRHGKWKLHLRYYDHDKGGYQRNSSWTIAEPPLLFNVEEDPSERFDIAADNPAVVEKLVALADSYKAEIERLGENKQLVDWFLNDWPREPWRFPE
jgi:arylsulfatase A-like enzyme